VAMVPFESESRESAEHGRHIVHLCRAAQDVGLPMLGLPLHRNGPSIVEVLQKGFEVVREGTGGYKGVIQVEVCKSLEQSSGLWERFVRELGADVELLV
jgi:hypothetical protein